MEDSAPPTDERFVELARTRDPALRERLIADHLDVARRLAGRFVHRQEPFDDLFQVASLGLVKAVDGFRPELGHSFSAYAVSTILGELKRHFRDHGWSVRAPRRLQELWLGVRQATEELSQELGRSPDVPELAARLSVREEDVLQALEAGQAYRSSSLDATVDDGETPIIKLGAEDPHLELAEDLEVVRSSIQDLAPRERRILHLRFFSDLTQSEIAKEVGLSQMQISRLLERTLSGLRDAATTGSSGAPADARPRARAV